MKLELIQRSVNADGTVMRTDGKSEPHCSRGRDIDVFIDTETGVQYFVMNTSNAGAICPRYNADGSLYVTISV